MDEGTKTWCEKYGIDPNKVGEGNTKLLSVEQYEDLSEEIFYWSRDSNNKQAIAHEIETEHERHKGLLLRNLYDEGSKKSRIMITKDGTKGPFFFNWTPVLPKIWEMGTVALVEGPKDALFLWSHGIPTVAFLGIFPSTEFLKTLSRYAKTAILIPDNENWDERKKRNLQLTEERGNRFGLKIQMKMIPAKDPAELKGNERAINEIRRTIDQTSKLYGGGYKNANSGRIRQRTIDKTVPIPESESFISGEGNWRR